MSPTVESAPALPEGNWYQVTGIATIEQPFSERADRPADTEVLNDARYYYEPGSKVYLTPEQAKSKDWSPYIKPVQDLSDLNLMPEPHLATNSGQAVEQVRFSKAMQDPREAMKRKAILATKDALKALREAQGFMTADEVNSLGIPGLATTIKGVAGKQAEDNATAAAPAQPTPQTHQSGKGYSRPGGQTQSPGA